MPSVRKELDQFARSFFEPSPAVTVAQWAEANLSLSRRESETAGPYSTRITPFVREILECFRDPTVHDIAWVAGSQVAKTLTMMIGTNWTVAHDPGPVLWVTATEHLARSFSETRWMPLVMENPAMARLVPADTDKFKILQQHFEKSTVTLVGSNSPASLASRPARLLILDEVDKFPEATERESNAVDLAEQRTKTFTGAKRFKVSTPTTEGGLIWREYLKGDQRKFFLPCVRCGAWILLSWDGVQWDESAKRKTGWDLAAVRKTAHFVCPECNGRIDDGDKVRMLRDGQWRPTASGVDPHFRSYCLPSLYSPWASTNFGALAVKFLQAKEGWALQGFVNGYLAQPWKLDGERVDEIALGTHREKYESPVPHGVYILTAGIDVQDDRLECELVGWGESEESWSIEYQVIPGDPARPDLWRELDAWLLRRRASGIAATIIDSGGHHTQEVYEFCRPRQPRRVYAGKGQSRQGMPVVSRPNVRNAQRARVYMIGTDTAKATLMAWFKVESPGPGYCHFPEHYDDEHFRQLTAEELRVRYVKGFEHRVWHKIRRNEALDCRVYAYAAYCLLSPMAVAMARQQARARQTEDGTRKTEQTDNAESTHPLVRRPAARRGGWVGRW